MIMMLGFTNMKRFKLWLDWNKRCLNHPFYKFLVLIGLAKSPTFELYYAFETDETSR